MTQAPDPILSIVKRGTMAVLYVIWVTASLLFTLPILLFQQVLPNRSPHHGDRYGYDVPSRGGVIAYDVVAVIAAYVIGDILRCVVWRGVPWPEVVANYQSSWPVRGSTLSIHLKMLACLVVAWPLILGWLGWYKPRWRSWRWRAVNTVAAAVLLGMAMLAAAAMTTLAPNKAWIYPRGQIVFVVALLPLMTAVVWNVGHGIRRALGHAPPAQANLDAGW